MSMHNLHEELIAWLDQQTITSENIGYIRRQCFVPWGSPWNALVRDETAAREVRMNDTPELNDDDEDESGSDPDTGYNTQEQTVEGDKQP